MLEIKTKKGYVYAICTHRDSFHGPLIRISSRYHDKAILEFDKSEWEEISFSIFIIWGKYIDEKKIKIVGKCDLPEQLKPFPIFKAGIVDPSTGRVPNWWLWDGVKEWRVGTLCKEEQKYPFREMWDDIWLIRCIETGWKSTDVV